MESTSLRPSRFALVGNNPTEESQIIAEETFITISKDDMSEIKVKITKESNNFYLNISHHHVGIGHLLPMKVKAEPDESIRGNEEHMILQKQMDCPGTVRRGIREKLTIDKGGNIFVKDKNLQEFVTLKAAGRSYTFRDGAAETSQDVSESICRFINEEVRKSIAATSVQLLDQAKAREAYINNLAQELTVKLKAGINYAEHGSQNNLSGLEVINSVIAFLNSDKPNVDNTVTNSFKVENGPSYPLRGKLQGLNSDDKKVILTALNGLIEELLNKMPEIYKETVTGLAKKAANYAMPVEGGKAKQNFEEGSFAQLEAQFTFLKSTANYAGANKSLITQCSQWHKILAEKPPTNPMKVNILISISYEELNTLNADGEIAMLIFDQLTSDGKWNEHAMILRAALE